MIPRRRRSAAGTLILAAGLLFLVQPLSALEGQTWAREDFLDLRNWQPLTFPDIPRHTLYTIQTTGASSYLRTQSQASSSALLFRREFDVYAYPNLRWRWKVDNVYRGAEVNRKNSRNGDDYPIRVFITFKYDPLRADFLEKLTYRAVKRHYGEYPPHSALNYVWASNPGTTTTMANPYSDRTMMVFLQAGGEKRGRWIEQSVNILEDYRRLFGEDPPATASLAIMNDSDNTGQSSVSYIEFLEIFR